MIALGLDSGYLLVESALDLPPLPSSIQIYRIFFDGVRTCWTDKHLAGYKRVTYIWQGMNVSHTFDGVRMLQTLSFIYIDIDLTSNGNKLKVKSKHMSMMPSKLK